MSRLRDYLRWPGGAPGSQGGRFKAAGGGGADEHGVRHVEPAHLAYEDNLLGHDYEVHNPGTGNWENPTGDVRHPGSGRTATDKTTGFVGTHTGGFQFKAGDKVRIRPKQPPAEHWAQRISDAAGQRHDRLAEMNATIAGQTAAERERGTR